MWDGPFVIARSVALVAAVVAALAMQRLRPWRRMQASTSVNVVFWLAGAVLTALVCGGCTVEISRWCARSGFGLFHAISVPLWLSLPITVAGLDFVSYGWHRLNHAVPFFWRFHQVHHSDTAFTVSTAARFHPGELFLSFPLRMAGVAVLGAPAVAVAVFEMVFAAFNFMEHGNIDHSRALERRLGTVFIVPALHRRHHSRKPDELNSNYGTIFSLWDRSFGTFGRSPAREGFRIGLAGTDEPLRAGQAMRLPLQNVAWGPHDPV